MLRSLPAKWKYPLLFGGGGLLLHTLLIAWAYNYDKQSIGKGFVPVTGFWIFLLVDFPLIYWLLDSSWIDIWAGWLAQLHWASFDVEFASLIGLVTIFGGLQWFLIGAILGALVRWIKER